MMKLIFPICCFLIASPLSESKVLVDKADLYAPISFFDSRREMKISRLDVKQKKELKSILNRFDLFREGEKAEYPFCGLLAVFRIQINNKQYMLSMLRNLKHVSPEEEKFFAEHEEKVFDLQELNKQGKPFYTAKTRTFESAALYLELEKFIKKHAIPVKKH